MQRRDGPGPYFRERLRFDGQLWLELTYCNEHGVPHSSFLEWEPADRAKALAFMMEKGLKCDLCGTAQWEWEENQRAYEPQEAFCMGCYLKEMAQEGSKTPPGTTMTLISTTSRTYAQGLLKQKRRAEEERARRLANG